MSNEVYDALPACLGLSIESYSSQRYMLVDREGDFEDIYWFTTPKSAREYLTEISVVNHEFELVDTFSRTHCHFPTKKLLIKYLRQWEVFSSSWFSHDLQPGTILTAVKSFRFDKGDVSITKDSIYTISKVEPGKGVLVVGKDQKISPFSLEPHSILWLYDYFDIADEQKILDSSLETMRLFKDFPIQDS